MTNSRRNLISVILLTTAFLALLNQTAMITALPIITDNFHISLNLAQWLTSGYILVIGLITPLSANLIDKYSSRQIFIGVVGLLLFGSLVGPLTNNFYILLAARLLQAVAGGILMTFVQISLISLYPVEKRGAVLGMVALVISAGPAIGPSFSGLVMQFFSWKALFYIVSPIIALLLILGICFLPNFSEPTAVKIDMPSVMSSIIGLGSILGSISLFSSNVLGAAILLIFGILVTFYFVHRQLTLTTPLLNLRLFKKASFTKMTLIVMLIFGILIGTEALLPIFLENVNHYSSLIAGLVLLPGAIANTICAPIVGRYYDQHGPKVPITIGVVLLLISSIPLVFLTKQTNIWIVIIAYIIRLIGVSTIIPTAVTEALSELAPAEISHGTAISNTLRQITGSAFTTLMILITTIPAQFVTGFHLAIWLTVICTVLLMLIAITYLRSPKKA